MFSTKQFAVSCERSLLKRNLKSYYSKLCFKPQFYSLIYISKCTTSGCCGSFYAFATVFFSYIQFRANVP